MPAVLERASDIGTADCLCFNGAGDNGVLAVQSEQRQMHRCRLCADFGNDGCRGCVDGSGAQAGKVGSGVITGVEKKRFTLDGKTVYYLSSPKDVFNGETLEAGKAVNVYRYGKHRSGIRENIFLSRSSFNEATLKKAQIYPEIFLKTVGLYWGLLLVSGGVILPFWAGREKLRRKKTQQRGGAEQR